ncbi:hypothetical protein LCGT_0895 [Lactococcus garvieae ATCC 49156]|uniref:Uncharacterized protein n=1 Tax=Lactococcus garvieae (strain Lg2) TaxID=420890 RepID=F9VDH5_LACGL|nr:hypothetical protein LCGT_0895 [Lactococcus garvieae ATCC 49156]BAK60376.1 hypothetical protein LCGL_0916 [Lactococcus garvieae Lg2]
MKGVFEYWRKRTQPKKSWSYFLFFSHPDFTVGCGIPPHQAFQLRGL